MALIQGWHAEGRTVVAVLARSRSGARAHFPETLLLARDASPGGRPREVLRPAQCGSAPGWRPRRGRETAPRLPDSRLIHDVRCWRRSRLGFMRRALAGCLALSVAGPPLGRVPGAAADEPDERRAAARHPAGHRARRGGRRACRSGRWGWAALLAGLAVALLAGWLARATGGREDSQLAGGLPAWRWPLGVAIVSAQPRHRPHATAVRQRARRSTTRRCCSMAGVATRGAARRWR